MASFTVYDFPASIFFPNFLSAIAYTCFFFTDIPSETSFTA